MLINQPQTFVFIGRSGSGKGTQLDLLKNSFLKKDSSFSIKIITMGEIFRNFFKESGFIQDIARQVSMQEGKFQPDFLTNGLFISSVINKVDKTSILFFDGYPRNLNQLQIIKDLFIYIKREKPVILNIEVSREEVKKRMLSRGRGDDNQQAIENRLDEYEKFIIPMLEKIKTDEFFTYLSIDGEGQVGDIHKEIINKLNIN